MLSDIIYGLVLQILCDMTKLSKNFIFIFGKMFQLLLNYKIHRLYIQTNYTIKYDINNVVLKKRHSSPTYSTHLLFRWGYSAFVLDKNLFYISYTLNKAQQWILKSINCALSFYIMRILCIDHSHFHYIFHTKYRQIQSLLCSCTCSICLRYLR